MTTPRRAPSFDRGGDRNYDRLPQAAKDAVDFLNWATEEGARREVGARTSWAAHAVRHLAATAPDRHARALASWKAGRTDLYPALIALAEGAA